MFKLNFTPYVTRGKALFAKRWVNLTVKITGYTFVVVGLLFFSLLGRLAFGPINLDYFTQDIESELKDPKAGISASIGHTQLVWRSWLRPFEIELVNVNVQKEDDPHWIDIKQVGVSLRLPQLLTGNVSLKKLRIYGPQVLLERDEEGNFSFELNLDKDPQPEFSFSDIAPLLASDKPLKSLGKLGELTQISIVDANVVIIDKKANLEWALPLTTATLKRTWTGLNFDLSLKPWKGKGGFSLNAFYKPQASEFDVGVKFHRISFTELVEREHFPQKLPGDNRFSFDDMLLLLHKWDIPLNGKMKVTLNTDTFAVVKGKGNISLGQGKMDLALADVESLPISSGIFKVSFTPNDIIIHEASLSSELMKIIFSGRLSSPSEPLVLNNLFIPGQTLEVLGKISELQLDHLSAVWPQTLSENARSWVGENFRKGILSKGTFLLSGQGSPDGFIIDKLGGTLEGVDAQITYLKGLPPAENVHALAEFDQKGFDITLLSGNIDGINLEEGKVKISNLDTDNETIAIDVKGNGPLSDILSVINHEPLEYAKKAGLNPQKVSGQGALSLHMDFPLIAELPLDAIHLGIKGKFEKVRVERKITDKITASLSQGTFKLDLTSDKMKISGKGILNKLPSTITYTHLFKNPTPYELKLDVEANASFEDFKNLGFDFTDYGQGITQTKVSYSEVKGGGSAFSVNLGLTDATLTFEPLGWKKESGETGKLSFSLAFKDGELFKMQNLDMTTSPYFLKGEILFGPNSEWKTIALSQFKGPHTDTQLTLEHKERNAYEVSFTGNQVNLENFLLYVDQVEKQENTPFTQIKIEGELGSLRLGEGRIFNKIKGTATLYLEGEDSQWHEVRLRAEAGNGTGSKGDMAQVSGGILFDLAPSANNTHALEIRANDAGQLLRNLDIFDEINGGNITVNATQEGQGPFKGTFEMTDFDIHRVPLLGRFAALLSPLGIVNLLSPTESVSLEEFKCDFDFGEELIKVRGGIGTSLSLGFTVEGSLDRKKRQFALKGNVIPARFINSILNNIPIIGSMITGGKGEGLFGVAYTATGSFDAPNISLDPSTALTPGFIRNIFQSSED